MSEDRAEAALAEAAIYQLDFKSNSVSEEQIHKLRQLRQRRLQIQRAQPPSPSQKRKSKKRKTKTNQEEDAPPRGGAASSNSESCKGESAGLQSELEVNASHLSLQKPAAPRKRQKLHWGLDVKERWERKGNM